MYAFFDKHGKKVLAVVSVLLMIAFLQSPYQSLRDMGSKAGKINGVALDPQQYNSDQAVLAQLNQILVPVQIPGQGIESAPVGMRVLPGVYEKLSQNPMCWHLLATEARQAGIMPSDNDLESTVQGTYLRIEQPTGRQLVPFAKLSADGQDIVRSNVRVLVAIAQNFERSLQSIKISQPLLNDQLALQSQKINARFTIVDAAKYEGSVDADLATQFAAYANIPEGQSDPKSNPFGFGYRVPDRVKIQYFKVPTSEIEKSVIATRTPQMWEEEARILYEKNKASFAELPKPDESTTQPSTQPASTQPVILPFEKISEKVYSALRSPMFEARRKAVVGSILSRLNQDYQSVSQSYSATTQQVVAAKIGDLAVGSEDYLKKIQAEISKQFGVNIELVFDARMLSADEMAADTGLGQAIYEEMQPFKSASEYIFGSMKQFASLEDKDHAVALSDLYQPLKPLVSMDSTYILRVVDAQPAHAPSDIAQVKDKVERDVRRKKAFEQAVATGESILAKAKESGLGSISGQKIYTTDLVAANAGMIKELPDATFANALVSEIFKLQRGLTADTQLPVRGMIKLPQADKVAVAELFAVQTEVTTANVAFAEYQAKNSLNSQLFALGTQMGQDQLYIMQQWFDLSSVSARVGYVAPAIEEAPAHSDKNKPAPKSPFQP